jgi:histidyl-tRNA synthetase
MVNSNAVKIKSYVKEPIYRMIEPKVLKGFRDFLPEQAARRKAITSRLEEVFQRFGFLPIDTPVLEYREVLLGKGGGETDKQLYAFTDQGGREVAMRFDLTVPFARFMAAHGKELTLPFRRYHIDKVWRGENTQKGRYREFVQCDFDIVGADSASADLEILLMMHSAFEALNIDGVNFKINHRGLFNRFLSHRGMEDSSVEILRLVDKLGKAGPDWVEKQLTELVGADKAGDVLSYIHGEESSSKTLEKITELSGGRSEESRRFEELLSGLKELGIGECFQIDPSITRGLDYYTGIVYETFLTDLPGIGSVCSGGRYNNLASLYTKQELPGVGSSIGLDRLVAALEELGKTGFGEPASRIAIFSLDEKLMPYYHKLAMQLRSKDLSCEVNLSSQKLGKQFAWAEKQGIAFAFICGEDEIAQNRVTVKNLKKRESKTMITLEEAIAFCRTEMREKDLTPDE